MNNKIKMVLGIGSIIIAVTLVWFLIGFSPAEKTTLDWIALLFMLIAEVSFIIGLIILTNRIEALNSIMLKSGIISTLSVYLIATILLALCRTFFDQRINAFVSAEITIGGIAAIIIMTLVLSSSVKS